PRLGSPGARAVRAGRVRRVGAEDPPRPGPVPADRGRRLSGRGPIAPLRRRPVAPARGDGRLNRDRYDARSPRSSLAAPGRTSLGEWSAPMRLPRFRLRTLLVAVAIAGAAMAAEVMRRRSAAFRDKAEAYFVGSRLYAGECGCMSPNVADERMSAYYARLSR